MEKLICYNCLTDPYLREVIVTGAESETCHYCGTTDTACKPLDWLIDLVEDVLDEQFSGTSQLIDELPPLGFETKQTLLKQLLGVNTAILNDLIGATHLDDYYADSDGENIWYDERWDEFLSYIADGYEHHQIEESILPMIFHNVDDYKDQDGTSMAKRLNRGVKLWRTRHCFTKEDAIKVLNNPYAELAPPPKKHASSGRMNKEGVSVFYGAEDLETCQAEVRPVVGGYLVSGQFEFLFHLRILNLSMCENLAVPQSRFHPNYITERGQKIFLKQFNDEISKPILPGDEIKEYLVTQEIVGYLESNGFDGLEYRSAQSPAGSNVVLFHEIARNTRPDSIEGTMKVEEENDGSWRLSAVEPHTKPYAPEVRLILESLRVDKVKGIFVDTVHKLVTFS